VVLKNVKYLLSITNKMKLMIGKKVDELLENKSGPESNLAIGSN